MSDRFRGYFAGASACAGSRRLSLRMPFRTRQHEKTRTVRTLDPVGRPEIEKHARMSERAAAAVAGDSPCFDDDGLEGLHVGSGTMSGIGQQATAKRTPETRNPV